MIRTKKVFAIVIIIALLIMSIPVFAENGAGSTQEHILIDEGDTDFFYIQDQDKKIYKYYPEYDYLYKVEDKNNLYFDIANKDNELYGVRNHKLFNLDSEGSIIAELGDSNINSLEYNNGKFYYVENGNVYAYDGTTTTLVKETGYQSEGDIVAFNGNLYFASKDKKIIKIDFNNFYDYDASVVATLDIENIYGMAVVNDVMYIGYGKKISSLNNDFTIKNTVNLSIDNAIYGMAQGTKAEFLTVDNVNITGELKVGKTLTGSYDMSNNDGNVELKWFLDDMEIADENGNTLVVKEEWVNKDITFEVTPLMGNDLLPGDKVSSDPVTILEPNLYITVDDGYTVYFNGVKVGSDSHEWNIVDGYYVDSLNKDEVVIAVKGYDRNEGNATISGFSAVYRTANGELLKTDNSWFRYYEANESSDGTLYLPSVYENNGNTYNWYDIDYKSNNENWKNATIIPDEDIDRYWNKSSISTLLNNVNWIWSENYKNVTFDSPVYFRNVLKAESVYSNEYTKLTVENNTVKDGETTFAYVTIRDQYNEIIDDENYDVSFFDDAALITETVSYVGNGVYSVKVSPTYGKINKVTATVNSSDVTNFENISVQKANAIYAIDLNVSSNKVIEGNNVIGTVTVKDQYDDLISGLNIVLKDDLKEINESDNNDGTYSFDFIPDNTGDNTITASISTATDMEIVEVVPVVNDVEIGKSTNEENTLVNSYNKLVLLAQMRTLVPSEVGNLRNDILTNGQNVNNLKNDNYIINNNSFNTFAETVAGGKKFGEINYLATEAGVLKDNNDKIIGEMDTVVVDYHNDSGEGRADVPEWHTIQLNNKFVNPIVIAEIASYTGGNYTHIRVKNITENSFDVFLEEWSKHRDTNHHYHELVSYIVVESGSYKLNGGTYIEASKINNLESTEAFTYSYEKEYVDPKVFSQTQTYDNESQIWMRQNNITTKSVDLVKQDENTEAIHPESIVGVLVIAKDIVKYPPVIEGIADTTIEKGSSFNESDGVTATDNEDGDITNKIVITGTVDENTVGRYTVKYEVTDTDRNNVEVIRTVTVKETNTGGSTGGNTGGSTGGGGYVPPSNKSIKAVTDNLNTLKNQVLTVSKEKLMENDKDADEFVSVKNGASGSVKIDENSIIFTPDKDFVGRAYFYYTVKNDKKEEDRGTVIVEVEESIIIPDDANEVPLSGGVNKDAGIDEMILIETDIVPLGTIEFLDAYILGYPDKTFRSDKEITRAEMATILARILKLDVSNPGEQIYSDVTSDKWYFNYIQAVSQIGVFNGYEDGSFKPNQSISHAEIAAVFSKYWEIKGIEIDNTPATYNDIDGHWAQSHINRFYNAGVSVGFIDGSFRPNDKTKRSELVIMVNRVIDRENYINELPSFTDVLSEFWAYGAIEAATHGFIPLEQ